jgi:hypothetical protein
VACLFGYAEMLCLVAVPPENRLEPAPIYQFRRRWRGFESLEHTAALLASVPPRLLPMNLIVTVVPVLQRWQHFWQRRTAQERLPPPAGSHYQVPIQHSSYPPLVRRMVF